MLIYLLHIFTTAYSCYTYQCTKIEKFAFDTWRVRCMLVSFLYFPHWNTSIEQKFSNWIEMEFYAKFLSYFLYLSTKWWFLVSTMTLFNSMTWKTATIDYWYHKKIHKNIRMTNCENNGNNKNWYWSVIQMVLWIFFFMHFDLKIFYLAWWCAEIKWWKVLNLQKKGFFMLIVLSKTVISGWKKIPNILNFSSFDFIYFETQ